MDNLFEKCTWEFEFVVPRYLEERHASRGNDSELEGINDGSPTVVICSGDLSEQASALYFENLTTLIVSSR